MQRIRCAFFFHDTDLYSGGSKSLLDIIDTYLEEKNIDVTAVFPSNTGSAIEYLKSRGSDIVYSHYYQIRYDLAENKRSFRKRLLSRIIRLLGSKLWISFKTVLELRRRGINIVYSNTSFILAGYWAANALKIPLIAHFREFGEEDHKIGVWIGRNMFYRIANNFDIIICVSMALKTKYDKYIDKNKIRVVYDDISPQYVNWTIENRKIDYHNAFNILIAGNLIQGKRQLEVLEELADFIKHNNAVHIYIAGSSSDMKYVGKIEKFIQINEMTDQIKLLGLVEDMNSLRKNMHIGIVFSDMEAFGRITIEGMLSGMIMLASNSGGSSELIKNGETGFLVEKDGSNLKSVVTYIYENYNMFESVQKEGFLFAKKFTEGRCAMQLANYMNEVVNK